MGPLGVDTIIIATLVVAVVALLVARRRSAGDVRGAEPGERPIPPDSTSEDAAVSERELRAAWLQFLRDDVANAANALNSRLNVIANTIAQVGAGYLPPEKLAALEQIKMEVERATKITGGLLHRVIATAPDMAPPAWNILRDRPVRPGHILVVEDDEANRQVLTRLFRSLGHRVTPARNGIEAYEILQQGSVDCIISDLGMPHLGGKGLFEQVEARMPNMAGRFVFVTGDYTRPASAEFLIHAGQPVIGKPYEIDTLLAAVATVLTSVGVLTQEA